MAKEEKNEKIFITNESSKTSVEAMVNKHLNLFIGIIIAILLIVLAWFAYKKWIREPKRLEASAEIFHAEQYFEIDSFRLALDGDGTYPGFLDIIDNYGSTPTGNLANYYTGVCYMRLGEYEAAIDYFKDYKSDEKMTSAQALGNIGNAYMELNDYKSALKYYIKASETASNKLLSPYFLLRAGQTCELLNDNEQALKLYEKINKEYFQTSEQNNIEKYIERVKTKIANEHK